MDVAHDLLFAIRHAKVVVAIFFIVNFINILYLLFFVCTGIFSHVLFVCRILYIFCISKNMTGRLKMCTFWFFVFSRYTLQKLSGLTWSVLVSTVTHVKLLNMISHIFTTKRPLGTYHSALKREFYEESPCTNNGKMVYGQKVHIFNEPVLYYYINF